LLIGGRKLRGGFQNSLRRVSIPSAFWELGHYGNIETLVCLMALHQICKWQFKLSRMRPTCGSLLGLKGLLLSATSWDEPKLRILGPAY